MKIVFVGQVGRGQTSGMRAAALGRLGHDVRTVNSGSIWQDSGYLRRQYEQGTGAGSRVRGFNQEVLAAVESHRPAILWAEKQEYLSPSVLEEVRRRGVLTVHYNPDPYFSLSWKRTPHADRCLRLYDVLVVTKRYELGAYRSHARGAVVYSPLGYDPVVHAPPVPKVPVAADVAFVGGWEPRRERLLAAAASIVAEVRVWGYGWRAAQHPRWDPLRALRLGRLAPGRQLYWGRPERALLPAIREGEGSSGEVLAERYASAVACARISLGFLREVCPDQHTTRTFEIPAIGGFMLADRTEEHLEFFEEGKEAEYFGSEEELVDKVSFYLRHESARDRIARAGRERCLSSGYSYDERLARVLTELKVAAPGGAVPWSR